jgi:hypothetical protein
MTPIAELSLEQIDSLFGLDNTPDIKADPQALWCCSRWSTPNPPTGSLS